MLRKPPECLRFPGQRCSLPPTVGTGGCRRVLSCTEKRPTDLKFNQPAGGGELLRPAGRRDSGHPRGQERENDMRMPRICSFAVAAGLAAVSMPALAQETEQVLGGPHEGGVGLQTPATDIADQMVFLHDWVLLPIITVICLFV